MDSYTFRDLLDLNGLEPVEAPNGKRYVDVESVLLATKLVSEARTLGVVVKQIPINKNQGKRYFRIIDETKAEGEEVKMGGDLTWQQARDIYEAYVKREKEARPLVVEEVAVTVPVMPKIKGGAMATKRPVGRPKGVKARRVGLFMVESGIELPVEKPSRDGDLVPKRVRYPFGLMRVGESFYIEVRAWDKKDNLIRLKRRLVLSITKAEREGKGMFQMGREKKGYRVWRVE